MWNFVHIAHKIRCLYYFIMHLWLVKSYFGIKISYHLPSCSPTDLLIHSTDERLSEGMSLVYMWQWEIKDGLCVGVSSMWMIFYIVLYWKPLFYHTLSLWFHIIEIAFIDMYCSRNVSPYLWICQSISHFPLLYTNKALVYVSFQ